MSTHVYYSEAMTTTIVYKVKRYSEHDDLSHVWMIVKEDGVVISELYVDMATYEIRNVETHPDHRFEGHATALWNAASAMLPVRHATQAHRTDAGNAWATSVGGESAPCTDGCDCDGMAEWSR